MKKLFQATIVLLLITSSASVAFSSDLPNCPSDQTKSYDKCFGTYSLESGDKYVGEFKNGKRHGNGTYTYGPASEWAGDKYIGEWKDGSRNGSGTYTYGPRSRFAGESYEGEFSNGKPNGYGTRTFANGSKYVGEWKDGKSNGWGTYTYGPKSKWAGDKYVGEFKDDKQHGTGTYTYGPKSEWAGRKYVGEWKDDKQNGKGTLTYAHGRKYVGEWKDNKKNGYGAFTWPDGRKYVGEFGNDKYQGWGSYTQPDGHKYVGQYKDDKKNGYGVYTFAEGDVFFGNLSNGEFAAGLYVHRNGAAKFYEIFKGGNLTHNVHNVLPVLKQTFNSLDVDERQAVQYVLTDQGMYNSSIDGLWGRNTLNALAEFAVLRLKTIELNRRDVAENIIVEIAKVGLGETDAIPKISDQDPNEVMKVASGSGFYVSDEGHIITNHHVIDGCRDMKVHSKGRVLATLKIAQDEQNDLALLKIAQTPEHYFALSAQGAFPLQEIIVAGYPFGDRLSSTLKFTQGIVSSVAGLGNNYSQIQIDAAIQPGNSGGPILDEYGNVVAVAVSKLDAKYVLENFGALPEDTNFGVKASAVKNLMEGNNVPLKSPNTKVVSRQELSRIATEGTVHLTCWMTTAQIEQMKTKKVLFSDLE